jgi:hypothetical protein
MPVFDAEFDGLNPTKIHVLSYQGEDEILSLTSSEDIKNWLLAQTLLVGHNITCFDVPHLERLLNIKITARLIDTLALSWYLFPDRPRHGLEWWGRDFGVEKPKIDNWENLSLEEYVHRCQEDVAINTLLWEKQKTYLSSLYSSDTPEDLGIVRYLQFKMDCAREQERSKWKLDIPWCIEAKKRLEAEQQPRIDALRLAMPVVQKMVVKNPPAKPYKKDGTPSVEGAKWQKYLSDQGLTKDHSLPISVLTREEAPNPNSPEQIKDWLFSLGWEPETFKFVKEDDGTERKIPQIKIPNSPDICGSVLELAEEEPAILELEGLSVVKHRLGIFNGFLENVDEEGCLKARVQGFTNTLRFKHTEIVNLPGVNRPFGKEIRGCLVARDGYELVGTDMVSLEDNTKRHFMYFHDPDYVNEMSDPSFDPHLDLAIRAGAVGAGDVKLYQENKDNKSLGSNLLSVINSVTSLRKAYKVVNYSSVYGVGAKKLARELKCSVARAKDMLEKYWQRNWAVKKVAEDCEVKRVNGQMWLYNPVSKFWYSLRNDKDRFSTLNQGTGVYCFDMFVREVRKQRSQITSQFHDEICQEVKLGNRDKVEALLKQAIKRVNETLKLNVELQIDTSYGYRYSEIHG